ncbi:MAG: hypothetical protein QOH14_3176 [Pseudonocardiales bacterium]|jgi:uncharacterized protein YecE (DUF72 family)|nr:hypothetical protein [Pseudonocardiales bacterium]
MQGTVRIGISGWTYPPWRGVFYPKGLPHRAELSYAASRLSTIEINGSFYSLQRPTSYQSWYEQTPEDFVFSVKGARFITHMKKLRGVETPLANFFASGVLALREKLGPVLWQLPPSLGFDAQRLTDFFARLPRSTAEAAWLARRHDERLDGRALTETDADRPIRHAMEVRHDSFKTVAFTELLREHHIAVVVADTAGKWPLIREVTTDFVYVRLHGDVELYTSGYTDAALDEWAALLRGWAQSGHDCYVYFDNDVKVRAPFDAMALAARLTPPPLHSAASGRSGP